MTQNPPNDPNSWGTPPPNDPFGSPPDNGTFPSPSAPPPNTPPPNTPPPSTPYDSGNANAGFGPGNANAGFGPGNANAGFGPGDANAGFGPSDANAGFNPAGANPQYNPGAAAPVNPAGPNAPFPPAGTPGAFGQPTPPPVGGFPGGQAPFAPIAAAPKKSIGMRIFRFVAPLLVVGAIAIGVTIWSNQRDKDKLDNQVGTCITVSGISSRVDTTTVECSDTSEFHYLVASSIESSAECPTEDYSSISTTRTRRGNTTTVGKLCIMPDFKEGKCYTQSDLPSGDEFSIRECSVADFKVVAVHEVNDVNQCDDPEKAVGYPEPARTFCLGAPN